MSEQMEVVGTESATSMAATENAEDGAAAQPIAETTVETNGAAVGEGATPPPAGEDGTTQQMAEGETGAAQESGFTVSVPYKHGVRELTSEEAVPLVQMGMKMEEIKSEIDMIRTIAAARGKTFKETVGELWGSFEQGTYDAILESVGGNKQAADILMEKRRSEWTATKDAEQQAEQQAVADERQALTDRLAGEFAEIKADFPEITQFSEIPKQVVNDAITNGRNLYDAYLRYQRKEGKKVENNQQAQQRAAAASTGSKSDLPNGGNSAIEALLRGLNSI